MGNEETRDSQTHSILVERLLALCLVAHEENHEAKVRLKDQISTSEIKDHPHLERLELLLANEQRRQEQRVLLQFPNLDHPRRSSLSKSPDLSHVRVSERAWQSKRRRHSTFMSLLYISRARPRSSGSSLKLVDL